MSTNTPRFNLSTYGLGAIIAVIVLILCIVFWAVGKLEPIPAVLIAALAIARLT